jgi:hypothetical protein
MKSGPLIYKEIKIVKEKKPPVKEKKTPLYKGGYV